MKNGEPLGQVVGFEISVRESQKVPYIEGYDGPSRVCILVLSILTEHGTVEP